MQKYSSSNTSINSAKPPRLASAIDWTKLKGSTILDYGGGKYDNFKEYLSKYDIKLAIFDPFNRSPEENQLALSTKYDLVVCCNVLNVIDDEQEIKRIVKIMTDKGRFLCICYEGDKTGIGKQTGKDQYQQNQKTEYYTKHFSVPVVMKNKIITVQSLVNCIKKKGGV